MTYETILDEISDNDLTVMLNRADGLNTFTLEMGRELVEALDPLLVDEFAGPCPTAEGPPQSRLTYATGSSW